jgi:ABC-type Na+ efflux pump permease subunit
MRLSKAWLIAAKDLRIFRTKRNVLYSAAFIPFMLAVGLPLLVHFISTRPKVTASILENFLNAFSFFFVILAAITPTAISSYSLVGEKIQKSLEPLLAAPITDGELLMGKAMASFIPTIVPIWVASAIFMVLADIFSKGKLGYLYYPNSTIGLIVLLLVPLSVIFSIGLNVLISSRVNDVRTAQMYGYFSILPLAAVYLLTEIQVLTLDISTLWIIAGVLLIINLIMFPISARTFQREKILTEWK